MESGDEKTGRSSPAPVEDTSLTIPIDHENEQFRAPSPAHFGDTLPTRSRRDSFLRSQSSSEGPLQGALTSEKYPYTPELPSLPPVEDVPIGEPGEISPASFTASKERLEAIQAAFPLPNKSDNYVVRYLRWNFFSVYRRIFTMVFLVNIVALIVVLVQLKNHGSSIPTIANTSTAAAANICVGILMRNEHVVNALFRIACSLPHWVPLCIRRRAAKVYSYGGVHSSCGVAATLWYLAFCGLLIKNFKTGGEAGVGLAVTTGIVLSLLIMILIFAHPYLRMRLHDHFERIHRFAGWTAVAAIWAQVVFSVHDMARAENKSFGRVLVTVPTFWFLIVITCCIIYPWSRLRSRKVEAEVLSEHAARLHFDYDRVESCVGIRLTDSALMETHAFATIPNLPDEERGFSVLVSNAGDWTNKIIHHPPKRLWTRGAPTLGVMRVALCFKKVLVIATGSGIGPSLSFLQSNPGYPVRIIWSASNPVQNYGHAIVKAVFRADPEALIVDTKRTGRGDLVGLAYSVYRECVAEATVIISNPLVTRKVVYGLETRGVPVFGAIFDS